MSLSLRWAIVVLATAALDSGACENPRLGCTPVGMLVAADNLQGDDLLDLTGITLDGSACPTAVPACERGRSPGGGVPTPCLSFSIEAQAVGSCRATLTFSDRDTFVAETSFGAHVTGRCSGFPAQGDALFYVPSRVTDGGGHD